MQISEFLKTATKIVKMASHRIDSCCGMVDNVMKKVCGNYLYNSLTMVVLLILSMHCCRKQRVLVLQLLMT